MDEIETLKLNLDCYPNIKVLINEKDIKKWADKLSTFTNPTDEYVNKSKYNLLTSLVAEKYNEDAKNLLIQLENTLIVHPDLKSSKTFKRNIKSLVDFSFFSFMSELSFSNYLFEQGYKLNFNTEYKRIVQGEIVSRDIDIEAYLNENIKAYFEVYTPNEQIDINGFFDLPSFGDKFEQKIRNKEFKKFDSLIPEQLNGKIILAINYAYDERFLVFLTAFRTDFFERIESIVHKEIDGIILFHHDFVKEKKLRIDDRIIKVTG